MVAGALLPVLVWPARLAGLQLTDGVLWSAELVAGVVVLTGLVGAVLGSVATVDRHRSVPGDPSIR